jgi:hypothetical protein
MVTISCYYNHYNRDPINFTFIKYEKYIKIILNDRSIIITIEQLVTNYYLFQIYILSLLCTEDTEIFSIRYGKYGIYSQWYWKNLYFTNYYNFTELYKQKNPLFSQEPKRISGNKKIKKFSKLFDSYLSKIKDPIVLINEYYLSESIDLIEEINKYGKDIYSSIKNYL